MSVATKEPRKVWTEAELQVLPNEGYNHEVVNGKLILSPKNNFQHAHIHMELATALNSFAVQQQLGPGAMLDGEHLLPGFKHGIADLFKGWEWE